MDLQDMLTKPAPPMAADAPGTRTKTVVESEPDQRFAEAVDAEQQDGKTATRGRGDDAPADGDASGTGAEQEEVRRTDTKAGTADADADADKASADKADADAAKDIVLSGQTIKRGSDDVVLAQSSSRNPGAGAGGTADPVSTASTSGETAVRTGAEDAGKTVETRQANLLRGLDTGAPATQRAQTAQTGQTAGAEAPVEGDGDTPTPLTPRNGQQAAAAAQAQPESQPQSPSRSQGSGASPSSQQSSSAQTIVLAQETPPTQQQQQAASNSAKAAPAAPAPDAPALQAAATAVQDRQTQRAEARTAAQERRATASEASALDAATVKSAEARPEQPQLRGQGENILPPAVTPRGATKSGAVGQYQSDWVQAQQTASNPARAAAPVQAAPLPAEFATPAAVERHIAPQIVTAVGTRANGGVVEIMLDPPELGRVEISIELSETTLRATISAERQATGDLLRRHLDLLNQQFADAGFEQIDLGFSAFAEGEQGDNAASDEAGAMGTAELDPPQSNGTQHARSAAYPSVGMDLRL